MKVVTLLFSVLFLSTVATAPAYCIELFNKPSQGNKQEPTNDSMPQSANGNKKSAESTPQEPAASPAETKDNNSAQAPSEPITLDDRTRLLQIHLKDMSQNCPKAWNTQACLASMAESNKTLASLYAEDLDKGGFKPKLELIKEHCAASTAASQIEVPAYAMKSAMTECANTMHDLSETTKINPPLPHYQLLVTSIFCLDQDPRCKSLEDTLLKIK